MKWRCPLSAKLPSRFLSPTNKRRPPQRQKAQRSPRGLLLDLNDPKNQGDIIDHVVAMYENMPKSASEPTNPNYVTAEQTRSIADQISLQHSQPAHYAQIQLNKGHNRALIFQKLAAESRRGNPTLVWAINQLFIAHAAVYNDTQIIEAYVKTIDDEKHRAEADNNTPPVKLMEYDIKRWKAKADMLEVALDGLLAIIEIYVVGRKEFDRVLDSAQNSIDSHRMILRQLLDDRVLPIKRNELSYGKYLEICKKDHSPNEKCAFTDACNRIHRGEDESDAFQRQIRYLRKELVKYKEWNKQLTSENRRLQNTVKRLTPKRRRLNSMTPPYTMPQPQTQQQHYAQPYAHQPYQQQQPHYPQYPQPSPTYTQNHSTHYQQSQYPEEVREQWAISNSYWNPHKGHRGNNKPGRGGKRGGKKWFVLNTWTQSDAFSKNHGWDGVK